MPNHKITSGISARCGTLRSIWIEVSSRRSPQRDRPLIRPSTSPMEPPMAKPTSARHELMARCCHSSPLAERVQNAFNTPSGEGSTRVDSQPTDEASCQTMTVPTGSSQGRGVTTGDGLILPSRLLSFAPLYAG
jgi:hypothetical protein